MELTVESGTRVSRTATDKAACDSSVPRNYAVEEISAYIAIRDELLREAEATRSGAKMNSLSIANDFIVHCLRPAKRPYTNQTLPESDAARERKRCALVKTRVAELLSDVRRA